MFRLLLVRNEVPWLAEVRAMRCVVDQWSWLGRRLPVGDSQWVGCTVLSSVAPEGGSLNASNRALPIVVICVRLRSAAVCSQHLHLPDLRLGAAAGTWLRAGARCGPLRLATQKLQATHQAGEVGVL